MDDALILHFLQEVLNIDFKGKKISVLSEKVWKKVEEKHIAPKHTWQSMKDRFTNRLKDLSQHEKIRHLKMVNGESKEYSSRKRKSSTISAEDEGEGSGSDTEVDEPTITHISSCGEKGKTSTKVTISDNFMEAASVQELRRGISIIRKLVPTADKKTIAKTMIFCNGKLDWTLAFLRNKLEGFETIWKYDEDQILLSNDEDVVKPGLEKLKKYRSNAAILARTSFLEYNS